VVVEKPASLVEEMKVILKETIDNY
jgi:hypothetical protein